ncbi:MAG TPA: competence/damage-inducible protein A [Acidimicrobiales bacterium]|nr:competence/damage-inducible protein A [Acidimicrobiales bacterium]
MRCEVVAVGTELLLGQIVDTNSSWIGEHLALAGIDSHFQTKVGDNHQRIAEALRLALSRSDAVVVCGGLGPTHDDITRDVIADVMGVELVLDPDIEARIRAMFGARGRDMPLNNLRQAQVPAGATPMAQQPGTAPGLVCPVGDKVIYAVPGVPYEMQEMVLGTVLPDLQHRAGVSSVIASRVLRTWGTSESGLAEVLHDEITRLDAEGNPTIAFLASGIEGLKVRITAKAATDEACRAILDDEDARVRELIGDLVFGTDDENMEHAVVSLLRERGLTLAVAESVTGGLICSRLTDVPGSSAVFLGGVVSYASAVKHSVLGVPEGPVVTGEAAEAMADGVRRLLGADVGLGVTGVAGPTEQEGHRPGTVWFGLAIDDHVESMLVRLPGDRARIRQFATISLLDALRRRLVARAG